ncbi:911_t:CDS:2, partial [Racocetra fulgida]
SLNGNLPEIIGSNEVGSVRGNSLSLNSSQYQTYLAMNERIETFESTPGHFRSPDITNSSFDFHVSRLFLVS